MNELHREIIQALCQCGCDKMLEFIKRAGSFEHDDQCSGKPGQTTCGCLAQEARALLKSVGVNYD